MTTKGNGMTEQTQVFSLRTMPESDICCVSRTIAWMVEADACPQEVRTWALGMCNPILRELKRRERVGKSDERNDET